MSREEFPNLFQVFISYMLHITYLFNMFCGKRPENVGVISQVYGEGEAGEMDRVIEHSLYFCWKLLPSRVQSKSACQFQHGVDFLS